MNVTANFDENSIFCCVALISIKGTQIGMDEFIQSLFMYFNIELFQRTSTGCNDILFYNIECAKYGIERLNVFLLLLTTMYNAPRLWLAAINMLGNNHFAYYF